MWLARRVTVLFITHSIAEAVLLGDRVIVLTPRPGAIGDAFDVDLPRPRTLDEMTTERFGRHVARVRAALGGHAGAQAGAEVRGRAGGTT
jgi:NitT/TauT family transport system ATP-binding protein